jgi:hypothetical protein
MPLLNAFQYVIDTLNPKRKRITIPFAVNTQAVELAKYSINGLQITGWQYSFDPRKVTTVNEWDGSRSLQGVIQRGPVDPGATRGSVIVSIQGNAQMFVFGQAFENIGDDTQQYLNFCVPLYANANSPILITFEQDSDLTPQSSTIFANLNNFELPPYFFATFNAYP